MLKYTKGRENFFAHISISNPTLIGGSGFDMYVTDNGDVVADSDGSGAVYFENADLSGVKTKSDQGDFYEDDNNTYVNAGGLIVTSKSSGESITLSGWNNKDLGITLQDSEDIEVWVKAINNPIQRKAA